MASFLTTKLPQLVKQSFTWFVTLTVTPQKPFFSDDQLFARNVDGTVNYITHKLDGEIVAYEIFEYVDGEVSRVYYATELPD
jgi:hypothetical protein